MGRRPSRTDPDELCCEFKSSGRYSHRMLQPFLSALVPGLRHARIPLVSGLLWTLALWITFTDLATGITPRVAFFSQVEELAASAPTSITLVVITTLIFVLGALTAPMAQLAAAVAGRILGTARAWLEWQQHISNRRRGFAAQAEQRRTFAQGITTESGRERVRRQSYENEIKRLQALLSVSRLRLLPTLPNSGRKIVREYGQPPPRARQQLLESIAAKRVMTGFYETIDKATASAPSFDADFETNNAIAKAGHNFRDEVFGTDPLRLLQLWSQPLFKSSIDGGLNENSAPPYHCRWLS